MEKMDSGEQYQFTWPGKKAAAELSRSQKELRQEQERSLGRDGTRGGMDSENIYIEGDNLDALKLLQKEYAGRVKLVYIDPPYNLSLIHI